MIPSWRGVAPKLGLAAILVIVYAVPVVGQAAVQIKGAYIYNFLKHVEWDDDSRSLVIAVEGRDDALYRELSPSLAGRTAGGRTIEVSRVGTADEARDAHGLVLARSENPRLRQVAERLRGSSTLLITDGADDERSIMLNLITAPDGSSGFEANAANIIGEGVSVAPEIMERGGAETDVLRLYQGMDAVLQETRTTVEQQQRELETKQAEVPDRSVRSSRRTRGWPSKVRR